MKKVLVFIILALFQLTFVSAINLNIEKTPVNDVLAIELDNPAVFNLRITNLGGSDTFEIYSLIPGIEMEPKEAFYLAAAETKNIEVKSYIAGNVKKKTGYLNFAYKIHSSGSGNQNDAMTIRIMNLKDAFETSTAITPNLTSAIIHINNKINQEFNLTADFSSDFFTATKEIKLAPLDITDVEIILDKERMKKLFAGDYKMEIKLTIDGKTHESEGTIKYSEQEGISTKETSSGFFFRKYSIEKTNDGNVPATALINIKKNIVSRLFTTLNIKPDESVRKGVYVYYAFQRELKPGEVLVVTATTSWIYLILILLVVATIAYFVYLKTCTDVILSKRVAFVKTKGGEFALKVFLTVKAKKSVQKINIHDRIPALVKLYEKSLVSGKIGKNKLSWYIDSLSENEERTFSYVIYSKLGVVGKFELPYATAVYESEGKIKQAHSNKTYFMNEPIRQEKNFVD